ncbi:phosphotransferase enzyme family protein [Dictyobacter arantiisoli]|uniref:Homoserine kinase n=1 Tax=Dictyobacter arantiisoli TaxID=2014874 RepID=A0A5A5TJ28_9CHLR|nr:phosphotransferase [Dictyobacter arantiisoli]GCF11126.1 homoserine kinase [Dictyobacter arantiisoli]
MENSSYNSQIRQLRILAEAALTQYDIGSARLTLLSHHADTLFRVTAYPRSTWLAGEPPEKNAETRFVLRLCDSAVQGREREVVKSELQWLTALHRDANILVPEPVLTRNRELQTSVQIEDVEQERLCLLLRWVPGRTMALKLSPISLERMGIFMAQLHNHAHHFMPFGDFVRPHWDWTSVLGTGTVLDPDFASDQCDGLIGGRAYRLFSEIAERAHEQLINLPKTSDYYGLIHANLLPANYIFYQGEVGAIDFRHCSWNYYLYDIAVTLGAFIGHPEEATLRKAFFRGYESIHLLPNHAEQLLSLFMALRIIDHLNVLFRSKDAATHALIPDYLTFALGGLQQFLASSDSATRS